MIAPMTLVPNALMPFAFAGSGGGGGFPAGASTTTLLAPLRCRIAITALVTPLGLPRPLAMGAAANTCAAAALARAAPATHVFTAGDPVRGAGDEGSTGINWHVIACSSQGEAGGTEDTCGSADGAVLLQQRRRHGSAQWPQSVCVPTSPCGSGSSSVDPSVSPSVSSSVSPSSHLAAGSARATSGSGGAVASAELEGQASAHALIAVYSQPMGIHRMR